jgi:hypothetical protein
MKLKLHSCNVVTRIWIRAVATSAASWSRRSIVIDALHLPAVSEPFLAWTVSGEAEFQEREGKRPWVTHRLKKGSFFLTSGGAPYDCRWKALTAEPFESMAVFIELPLLQRAMEEVFGDDAINARLKGTFPRSRTRL